MRVYSLFDRKMKEYGSLVLGTNDATMGRALKEAVLNPQSPMFKYPEDFDLMCLGDFDVENGDIEGQTPQLVFNCKEVLNGAAGETA